MAKRSYILRAARPDESRRIVLAIEKWNDPFVLARPEAELKAAAEAGLFFIVTDVTGSEILGTSAVFTLREGEYVEVGTTYIARELRGFGIQELFFRIRIASIVSTEGSSIKITTAVSSENRPSLTNMKRCGFEEMVDLIAEQIVPCVDCPKRPEPDSPSPCCCNFYVLPNERSQAAVRALLDQVVEGKASMRNEKTGDELELLVKARVVSDPETRIALAEFADGKTW